MQKQLEDEKDVISLYNFPPKFCLVNHEGTFEELNGTTFF